MSRFSDLIKIVREVTQSAAEVGKRKRTSLNGGLVAAYSRVQKTLPWLEVSKLFLMFDIIIGFVFLLPTLLLAVPSIEQLWLAVRRRVSGVVSEALVRSRVVVKRVSQITTSLGKSTYVQGRIEDIRRVALRLSKVTVTEVWMQVLVLKARVISFASTKGRIELPVVRLGELRSVLEEMLLRGRSLVGYARSRLAVWTEGSQQLLRRQLALAGVSLGSKSAETKSKRVVSSSNQCDEVIECMHDMSIDPNVSGLSGVQSPALSTPASGSTVVSTGSFMNGHPQTKAEPKKNSASSQGGRKQRPKVLVDCDSQCSSVSTSEPVGC